MWTADGTKLVIVWDSQSGQLISSGHDAHDLRQVEIATGEITLLIPGLFVRYADPMFLYPSMLPDRSRVSFHSYGTLWSPGSDGSGSWAVWTANPDGTDLRKAYTDDQLSAALGVAGVRLMNGESWEP